MPKQYIVREGFTFTLQGARGHEKVFESGDSVEIADEDTNEYHQLEFVGTVAPNDQGSNAEGSGQDAESKKNEVGGADEGLFKA